MGWLVMDGWMDGYCRWMDAEGTSLEHRAESLMQTLLRHRVWRGKGALFAFKRSKSLYMCQGPMG